MNIGDQVLVLGQSTLGEPDTGTIERFEHARVVVKFPDGWTRYYKPEEIRVIEAAQAAGDAG